MRLHHMRDDKSESPIFGKLSALMETNLEMSMFLAVVAGSANNNTFINTKKKHAHLIESSQLETTFYIKNRNISEIIVKMHLKHSSTQPKIKIKITSVFT